MATKVDVVVIGGGAIGVACALKIAEAGREVLLLEKQEIGDGCSSGNMGWITPSHSLPIPRPGLIGASMKMMLRRDASLYINPVYAIRMVPWLFRFWRQCSKQAERHAIRALAAINQHVMATTRDAVERYNLDCEFQQAGLTQVLFDKKGLAHAKQDLELMQQVGINGQYLDPNQLRQREPNVHRDAIGGIYFPDDAALIPDRYVQQLVRCFPQHNVQLRTGESVQRLHPAGGRVAVIETDRAQYEPTDVVLACGVYTRKLAKSLGITLPIEPGKGYSVTVSQPEGGPVSPVMLSDSKVALTPWRNSLRIGSTMEFTGLDQRINARRVQAILTAARRAFTDLTWAEPTVTWAGLRPMTYDDLPIIGRPSRYCNLLIAAGHGMLGISLAMVTAELIVAELSGQTPMFDPAAFAVDRFGGVRK